MDETCPLCTGGRGGGGGDDPRRRDGQQRALRLVRGAGAGAVGRVAPREQEGDGGPRRDERSPHLEGRGVSD